MARKRRRRASQPESKPRLDPKKEKFLQHIDTLAKAAEKARIPGPVDPQLAETFYQYYTGTLPPPDPLPERIKRIIKLRWHWHYLMMGEGEDDLLRPDGSLSPEVMLPLDELLRRDWKRGVKYLREWVQANAKDVGELFQNPELYPSFVIWVALCTLKFDEGQGAIIREFLEQRVFRKVEWVGLKGLHEHMGITGQRDFSIPLIGREGLSTDIESALYEHFVTAVLNDTYAVLTNVLGWLYRSAKNRLRDMYDETQAASRLALKLLADAELVEPDLSEKAAEVPYSEEAEADRELLRQVKERPEEADTEADDELSAVEAAAASEEQRKLSNLLESASLTPKQRRLMVVLAQDPDISQKELAKKLGVKPPAVSQMLALLARNPFLRQVAASHRSLPDE